MTLITRVRAWINNLILAYKTKPLQSAFRTVVLLGVLYVMVFWRAFWTPDLLFFIFLLVFALYGQGRKFLFNFGPFALLLLTYDSFRGLAPFLNSHVHFTEMIRFDEWIGFGQLPTHWLQGIFYHGHISWLDYYVYFLYMCHFLTPWIVALVIWKFRPQHYARYIMAFLLLSYAGFLTYVLFPAAPPWMAAEQGLIPSIHKISADVWFSIGVHNFPTVYKEFSPNLVAAVPSLHAAYPTLIVLFLARSFGWRWGLAFAWYPISLWFGIVYMGEHYVMDALLGILYAVGAYLATNLIFARYGARARATRERLRLKFSREKLPVVARQRS